MARLYKRCVILKNLPPEIEESTVKKVLNLAHGDWCLQNKFEKLHKHIESDNDVRWIILFKTEQDAHDCITRGGWESSVTREKCRVFPDYCSGCIIPEKWEEEWDMMSISSNTSEDSGSSFIKLDSADLEENSAEEEAARYAGDQHTVLPTFGSDCKKKKPESSSHHEAEEDLFETMLLEFKNNLNLDSDVETSDSLIESRCEESEAVNSTGSVKPDQPVKRIFISQELLTSNDLFGKANGKEKLKTQYKTHSGILEDDQRKEMSTDQKHDLEVKSDEEDTVFSHELFGSGIMKDKADSGIQEDDQRKRMSRQKHDLGDKNEGENEVHSYEIFGSRSEKDNASSQKGTLDNVDVLGITPKSHDHLDRDNKQGNIEATNFSKSSSERKKILSESVRSADLFGNGDDDYRSSEFTYDRAKDLTLEAHYGEGLINRPPSSEQECRAPTPTKTSSSSTEKKSAITNPQNRSEQKINQQWISDSVTSHPSNMSHGYHVPTAGFMPHFPVPMQGNLNIPPHFMGYYINPAYQLGYPSMISQGYPAAMGQYVAHTPKEMSRPPMFFGPVYMPGMLPDDLINQTAIKSVDKNESTERYREGNSKSKTETDPKETVIYDVPYENIVQASGASGIYSSVNFTEKANDARSSQNLENSYWNSYEDDKLPKENIYDEVNDSDVKSFVSLPKRDEPGKNVLIEQSYTQQQYSSKEDTLAQSQVPPPLGSRPYSNKHKVLSKNQTELNQRPLTVNEKSKPAECSKDKDEMSDSDKDICQTVLVKGITEQISKDALELFFENKKKTGGGEVESTEINIKKGEAIIEFKKSEDALRVIARTDRGKTLTLLGQELTVCEYHPPPTDPWKLFITNIAETTTDECIINFLATVPDSEPATVIFGETPGTSMVCFEKSPDVSAIRKLCGRRKCEGQLWNISLVELTRSVKVTGLKQGTTGEALSLYFENKKRSDGGDVENVKQRDEDFIIEFCNSEDAERVCQKSHMLNGQKFKVALHYPCLELDEDFSVKIPPPIEIDIDEYIVKFITNNQKYKEEFENKLQCHNGRVVWPSADNENKDVMQVVCTVDPKDKMGRAKVKDWKEKCFSNVREITECLSVEKSKNVAVEVWTELKSWLQQISVPDPDSVAVFLESSDCAVVMAGEISHVQDLSSKIHAIISDIEKTLENGRQVVTKKKRLKVYEMALVRASRLETAMKKKLTEFEIDNEKREVIFKGKQKDVDDALTKFEDRLKSFVKRSVPGMTKQAIDLLFLREARDYVKKQMMEKKVMGVWDTSKSGGLLMYSNSEKELNIAIEIVQTLIVMDSFELDSEKKEILDSTEGRMKVKEFEENNAGFLKFEIHPSEFSFVCIDKIHKEIKDEFTKLFDLHSVTSKFLPADPGVFMYIVKYKSKEIDTIQGQYRRLAVSIVVKDSADTPGFNVKGKKDGCKLAINKLQAMIDMVAHKDITLPWPGFDKFIQSTEGRESIRTIELLEKCVIKVSSKKPRSGLEDTPGKETVSPERRKSGYRRIQKEVKIGSLASENVDVIVNTTNRYLDLKVGAVSRTLLQAGGDILEKECKTKYPDGIETGKVAVTSGGAMKCRALFHGLLVKWDGGQGKAEKVLENFIICCLILASKHQYSSIAFPALGTGALGFPADVVARIMFDVVDDYETKFPETSLKTVRFVVWSEDQATVRAFQDAEYRRNQPKTVHASSSSRHSYRPSAAETIFIKNDGLNTTIGPVSVNIVSGDLTAQTSGAIVNSTTDDLNLNSGAVSKAILVAAGDSIQNEALANKSTFVANDLVVTSPGKLMCQNIIHVRARNSMTGWMETIRKCLLVSEQLGFNSVAFPALGTGGKGVPAVRMARAMLEVFQDYIKSKDFQKCLKTIQIVIFDKKILEGFVSEARVTLDPSKAGKRRSFFPDLSDLKFWEHKPVMETGPGITLHVYTGSAYKIDTICTKINEIRKENDLFVPRRVFDHWEETHRSDLKRIGYSHGVKVVVEKSRVKVLGYGKAADIATQKAQAYIGDIEKDIKKGLSASPVKLPSSWTKMKLTDPTQIVNLMPTDPEYIGISNKFIQETRFAPTCIVKIERIQNPTLFTQYIGKKTQMELDNKGGRNVEQILWHGTKSTAVTNINTKGFDRNYNSGSSHGVGVYFAKNASMSASGYCQPDINGHKHIYLAHVLTGEYAVGQGGMRVPPSKPGSPFLTYDSTTDNVQNPNFFVIFHDAQAYPSFLITFR